MLVELDESEGLERKLLKTAQDNQLDRAVFTWFTQEHSDGTPISSETKEQAEKLKKDLYFKRSGEDTSAHQGNEFKASSRWLNHFLKRHGIQQVTISGETRYTDIKACDEYPLKLQEITIEGGYAPEQIYNADETDLCYRMLLDRTLASRTKEQKAKGFKDVFNLGETAWLGITPSMMEKCWHRGLKSAFVTESNDNQDEEDEDENNFEGFTEEEAMEAE
ncbi:unnamed protein product [Caretta caretta]